MNFYESELLPKTEGEIEDFFKEHGRELFNCGQGYSENLVSVICRVGKDFYSVTMEAEIGSVRQDKGDRVYHVETITNVEFFKLGKDYIPSNAHEKPLKAGDKLRHYKGGIYEYLYEGIHTESEEVLIVYKDANEKIWLRPKYMFFSDVVVDGSLVPRFAKID